MFVRRNFQFRSDGMCCGHAHFPVYETGLRRFHITYVYIYFDISAFFIFNEWKAKMIIYHSLVSHVPLSVFLLCIIR